jgi:hypothetical protein
MHCVYLADLAASLAQQGPAFLHNHVPVSADTVFRYWSASRSRHESWHRAIGQYREADRNGNTHQLRRWWSEHVVMLEEIVVSELLARVVAAIGRHAKRAAGDDDGSDASDGLPSVTHGVFLAQLEASNRVGRLILEGKYARVQDIVRLNRLRYGVERWTDWLIGRVGVHLDEAPEYCIDTERARAFRDEVRESTTSVHGDTTTWLMNAAMRDMLVRRTSESTALPDANERVASAALALFKPQLFDDYGLPKSLWLQRLQLMGPKEKSPPNPAAIK